MEQEGIKKVPYVHRPGSSMRGILSAKGIKVDNDGTPTAIQAVIRPGKTIQTTVVTPSTPPKPLAGTQLEERLQAAEMAMDKGALSTIFQEARKAGLAKVQRDASDALGRVIAGNPKTYTSNPVQALTPPKPKPTMGPDPRAIKTAKELVKLGGGSVELLVKNYDLATLRKNLQDARRFAGRVSATKNENKKKDDNKKKGGKKQNG